MAFVRGERRTFKPTFRVRAKGKSPAARKKELARFKADLKKVAKKYRGTVK